MRKFKITHPDIEEPLYVNTADFDPYEDVPIFDNGNKPFGFIRIQRSICTHIFLTVKRRIHINPYQWTYEKEIFLVYSKEDELLKNIFLN